MRRWLHALLVVLGAAVLFVLLAPPASAHTVLVGSDPADGSRLDKAPSAVTLRFSEQVGLQLGYVRVVDSAGRRVDSGSPTHPGGVSSSVTVALRPGLGEGSYLANYRVISADSHPVAGTIRYVVGDGPLAIGGTASGSAPVDPAVSAGLALSHWVSFAGVGMAGGSWLVFTLWPAGGQRRSVRRLIWWGWSLASLGAVVEYLLEGPYAAGTGLSSLADATLLDATLHGHAGQLLSLRVLLLGVLGMVLASLFSDDVRQRPSGGPEAAAVVGAGIVVTFAAGGHTQSASPRWLWVLVDGLHLSAMIVWLGGLVVLLVAALSRASRSGAGLAGSGEDRAEVDRAQLSAGLPVFSRVAMVCVAVLAVTGTVQAWREVGALDALTATRYGQLVLMKVLLFAGVLALGYLARRAVQRSVRAPVSVPSPAGSPAGEAVPSGVGVPGEAVPSGGGGSSGSAVAVATRAPSRTGLPSGLGRTLLCEVAIGALVLAATGVLVFQPPGKVALAAERGKPQHATVRVSAATEAAIDVSPGVHGNVRIAVQLSGGPPPTAISATASLPDRQLGPIPVRLQPAGPGSYTSTDVLLPAAGVWELALTVRTSEFDSTVAVARVKMS